MMSPAPVRPQGTYSAPVVSAMDRSRVDNLTQKIEHLEATIAFLRAEGSDVTSMEQDLAARRQELEQAQRGA